MRRKRFVFALIIFISIVIVYLFWPLGSERYKIIYDQVELEKKENFLKEPVSVDAVNTPNIILIMVDDMGMADCSLYGEGNIQTPNIDKLGSEGVVFENAYTTSPVCAPSRASLMTGRYQHRFGFEFTIQRRYLRNKLEYYGFKYFVSSYPWEAIWMPEVPNQEAINQQGLPPSELTLAEILKKKGYKTALIGKWHLGSDSLHLPKNFGFDEQYGFFSSHTLYAYEDKPGIVNQKIENDWTDPYIWEGQREGIQNIYDNYLPVKEEGYLTDRITDKSIEFLEKNHDQPFFIWISYNAPHTPLQAPREYVDRFLEISDPVKRLYAAIINNLDDNIGRLTKYFAESGLDENSIIFFISDNGGAEYTTTTDNGRYEGGKNTEFEGGLKVPMIMKWKGEIEAGKRFYPMVSTMDIFSTSLAAANEEPMPGRLIDGVDLLPFLLDSVQHNPHQYLYWQRGMSKAIRSDKWKLIFNESYGIDLLYNLETNKYENPELAKENPDVVRQLKEAYLKWQSLNKSPLWPSVMYFSAKKDGVNYMFEQ